jgi:hypothetical protein
MNPAYAQPLRELLHTQQVAALGTLHEGQPYVSMVPFALLPGGSGFVIHVSQLATHEPVEILFLELLGTSGRRAWH